ncbi:2,3-bisphosphoglycerate-independent phosphoglycerate mutase-like [Nylanderia fulva]|uniref:2,3-bisphosphoglycerate-independent phosphoglycerate mutase-like n=1 Tax=Nylanderia fulva TaxID=613905 RepID=UPI0010FAEA41|nr:2,3-bisphosphoglycerate-independent phosphoglycerate mutase-like [Nylanderia fulva]
MLHPFESKIDEWNHDEEKCDGVKDTSHPYITLLISRFPSFLIHAHGEYVGLSPGKKGNLEAGYSTIGAGRIVEQSLTRINKAISEGKMGEYLDRVKFAEIENKLSKVLSENGYLQSQITDWEKHEDISHLFTSGLEASMRERISFSKMAREYVHDPKLKTNILRSVQQCIREVEKNTPFIVCNFPPLNVASRVGGCKVDACKVTEMVDESIGALHKICEDKGYTLIITASYGNVECMRDENGNLPRKQPTYKVPLIICDSEVEHEKPQKTYTNTNYSLKDVAPTILYIMGIEIPPEMTGQSILKE